MTTVITLFCIYVTIDNFVLYLLIITLALTRTAEMQKT